MISESVVREHLNRQENRMEQKKKGRLGFLKTILLLTTTANSLSPCCTHDRYLIGDGDIDGAVDVKEVGEMKQHVELKEIKKAAEKEGEFKGFALLKQPRLSVVPVSDWVWERLCDMGGGFSRGDEHSDSKEE